MDQLLLINEGDGLEGHMDATYYYYKLMWRKSMDPTHWYLESDWLCPNHG